MSRSFTKDSRRNNSEEDIPREARIKKAQGEIKRKATEASGRR